MYDHGIYWLRSDIPVLGDNRYGYNTNYDEQLARWRDLSNNQAAAVQNAYNIYADAIADSAGQSYLERFETFATDFLGSFQSGDDQSLYRRITTGMRNAYDAPDDATWQSKNDYVGWLNQIRDSVCNPSTDPKQCNGNYSYFAFATSNAIRKAQGTAVYYQKYGDVAKLIADVRSSVLKAIWNERAAAKGAKFVSNQDYYLYIGETNLSGPCTGEQNCLAYELATWDYYYNRPGSPRELPGWGWGNWFWGGLFGPPQPGYGGPSHAGLINPDQRIIRPADLDAYGTNSRTAREVCVHQDGQLRCVESYNVAMWHLACSEAKDGMECNPFAIGVGDRIDSLGIQEKLENTEALIAHHLGYYALKDEYFALIDQWLACGTPECAVEIGKLLNVQ